MNLLIETQQLATCNGQPLYYKDERGNVTGMWRTDGDFFPCLKPTPRYAWAKMRPKSYAEQFGPFPQPTSVTATPEPQITHKRGRPRKQSAEQPAAKQIRSDRESEIVRQIGQNLDSTEQSQCQRRVAIKV